MGLKRQNGSGAVNTTSMWYDDPIFDDAHETIDGKNFKGDDWRRLQQVKEHADIKGIVPVAGTTFRADAVQASLKTRKNVSIVAEPTNPYDAHARRVIVGDCFVGYVPKGKELSADARLYVVKVGMDPQPHVWLAVGAC